jgi:hypothetical protein
MINSMLHIDLWIEVWTDLLQPIDQLRRTSCKLTTLARIAI